MTARTALLLACATLASGLPAQQTFVVDPVGNGTHKTIQAAVDAAKDGDWIVIRSATYEEEVRVHGKSLWMLGAGAAPVFRSLNVSSHPDGKTTRLTNLKIEGRTLFGVTASTFLGRGQVVMDRVEVNNTGTVIALGPQSRVVLQNSAFGGRFVAQGSGHGLLVNSPGFLLVNGCTICGGVGPLFAPSRGYEGLIIAGGVAEVSDSSLRGADGLSYWCGVRTFCGTAGGDGLLLVGTKLRLRGTANNVVRGGAGGWYRSPTSSHQAAGGDGIVVDSGGSVEWSGVSISGSAQSGRAIRVLNGTTKQITPSDPLIVLSQGFRFGASAGLSFQGKPSSAVIVMVCLGTTPTNTPFGPLYADVSRLITTHLTTLDAAGSGSLQIPTGNNLDIAGLPLYLQGIEVDWKLRPRLMGMVTSVPSFW